MRRIGVRALMVAVGVASLALYAAAAFLAAEFVASLWRAREDVLTILGLTAALTLAFSYASYRFGTGQLLARLDATEASPGTI